MQGDEMTESLKPVFEGIFEEGPSPSLIGGYCETCKRYYFPKPVVCPQCLGQAKGAPLSTQGTLYSYTVVRTKAPYGLPQPYAVGYVDLEESGLRIFSLLDSTRIEGFKIGGSLELRIGPVGVDSHGQPCLRYYFTPALNGGGQ
jgi:uncharacterized protein